MNDSDLNGNDVTQRGELARQQLLSVALELFAESGLEGTSTRQIARQAGQNIGAIAYYFNSKEGLYLAVAEHISNFIHAQFKNLLVEIQQFLASEAANEQPEQCLNYIKKITGLFCGLLTNPKTLDFSKFILREQLSPTAALQLMHKEALVHIHSGLARLIATYIGVPHDSPQVIIHTHAIIGETLFFRVGQQTFLLRIGRDKLGDHEKSIIEGILLEHTEFILCGLRAKHLGHD